MADRSLVMADIPHSRLRHSTTSMVRLRAVTSTRLRTDLGQYVDQADEVLDLFYSHLEEREGGN